MALNNKLTHELLKHLKVRGGSGEVEREAAALRRTGRGPIFAGRSRAGPTELPA